MPEKQCGYTFGYDAFGNVRTSQGVGADATGGDFRFQGQWLESATGLYNFRARDYDSRTGAFLSRDPVDPTEQQPEAMNPYQAVYSNPYLYSDPSGMISLADFSISEVIQKVLDAIETNAKRAIVDKVKQDIEKVAAQLLTDTLRKIIPGADIALNTLNGISLDSVPNPWEKALTDTFCNVLKSVMPSSFRTDSVWLEPSLAKKDGNPISPGINPFAIGSGCGGALPSKAPNSNQPELIVKHKPPTDTSTKSYLLTEVKVNVNSVGLGQNDQFTTFINYADLEKGRMWTPVVLYVGLKRTSEEKERKIAEAALKRRGVLGLVVDFGL